MQSCFLSATDNLMTYFSDDNLKSYDRAILYVVNIFSWGLISVDLRMGHVCFLEMACRLCLECCGKS